jgi:hypothetical protein
MWRSCPGHVGRAASVSAMGLFDTVLKGLRRTIGSATQRAGGRSAWGGRNPDKANYGRAGAPTPEMDALVTDAEIEEVTGASPVGEPRRNGDDGTDVDVGRHVIRESNLSNGDKFLISLGNCADAAAARLTMDRMAELEKPLDGVGERGLVRVQRYPGKGISEVGVTALVRNFTLSLTHTSTEGETDPGPVTELLQRAIRRL